jgi:hypothetical protein
MSRKIGLFTIAKDHAIAGGLLVLGVATGV